MDDPYRLIVPWQTAGLDAVVSIFVISWGQPDNLGDVILRRQFFTVLRRIGRLCVAAGNGLPDSYLDCLIEPEDEVFADIAGWRAEMVRRAATGRVALCEVPSEIVADAGPTKYFIRQSLLARKLRRLGAPSLFVGLGLRMTPGLVHRLFYRVALAPYRMLGWRDTRSSALIGRGFTMPDWAFGISPLADPDPAARDSLVVSLRGDRPVPSDRWVEAVTAYAAQNGLTIRICVQVYRDADAGRVLAQRLGCAFIQPASGFPALEAQVRGLYRSAKLVLSDRLHVLILAAIDGAVPACPVEYPETKIGRHFEAIGVSGVSQDVAGKSPAEIGRVLAGLASRTDEVAGAVAEARARLAAIAGGMAEIICGGPQGR